ncbi:hypothetical protein M9H77_12127 [Catharanthus roseus]|uniref:Uncharacterized protein n=1 Tax=Catharanthus roseus TaxID=4058 RepID=A0ACC0BGM1_CATRO|nr:hypothetical protein M9H77_12127 [Catharanthus roseus]
MNAKSAMMLERDATQKCVYELQVKLKLDFAILSERCQLTESDRDAKEHELSDITGKVPSLEAAVEGKEKDPQKALLNFVNKERLLVVGKDGRLNPQAPVLSYGHPWPSGQDTVDDLEGEILIVCFGALTEIFCLLEYFFVREGIACPSNTHGASTYVAQSAPITPIILENPSDGDTILLDDPSQDKAPHGMDGGDCPFE